MLLSPSGMITIMSRTMIGRRTTVSGVGERFEVLHFVRMTDEMAGSRSTGVRRRDEFETSQGHPVVYDSAGRLSVLIAGQWVDLTEA